MRRYNIIFIYEFYFKTPPKYVKQKKTYPPLFYFHNGNGPFLITIYTNDAKFMIILMKPKKN